MKKRIIFIVMTLLLMISGSLSAQTAYVAFCEGDNSLHFLCSDETLEEDGRLPSTGQRITFLCSGDYVTDSGFYPSWYRKAIYTCIEKVVFEESFKSAKPQNCHYWFYNCASLKTIEGMEYLNTSNVTSMSGMFKGCTSLASLDVSNFNTSNVTEMEGMFDNCSSLKSLDISNFNTSNVTNIKEMFLNCYSLSTLKASNLDLLKVTDDIDMFKDCSSLYSLNLSNLKITYIGIFIWRISYCCRNLRYINLT